MAEDREHRLAALRIRLHQTAREVRTADDWARCLRAAARLPSESWANVLLITSRIPAATLVKGYEGWRAAGRQVSRDEKGIEIFPSARQHKGNRDPDSDEHSHSWRDALRVAYVWDLSQTSGQPVAGQASILSPSGDVPPGLWEALCWLARREGFSSPRTWAGSDPRAQPGAAILASGERITSAAARIIRHLDHHLPGSTAGPAVPVQAETATPTAVAVEPASFPEPDARIESILLDAEQWSSGGYRQGQPRPPALSPW